MNATDGHTNLYESAGDAALVRRISSGSPCAMEVLMQRYLPLVSRLSYRMLCDISESERVTAEVFMRIWNEAGRYDFRRSVTMWIYQISCESCMTRVRHLRLMDFIIPNSSVFEMSAPTPLSPEEDYITNESWSIYCRAARLLNAKQRMVFVLCELEDLSTGEVASIMHMNVTRIRRNLLIARDKLKHELAKYGTVI